MARTKGTEFDPLLELLESRPPRVDISPWDIAFYSRGIPPHAQEFIKGVTFGASGLPDLSRGVGGVLAWAGGFALSTALSAGIGKLVGLAVRGVASAMAIREASRAMAWAQMATKAARATEAAFAPAAIVVGVGSALDVDHEHLLRDGFWTLAFPFVGSLVWRNLVKGLKRPPKVPEVPAEVPAEVPTLTVEKRTLSSMIGPERAKPSQVALFPDIEPVLPPERRAAEEATRRVTEHVPGQIDLFEPLEKPIEEPLEEVTEKVTRRATKRAPKKVTKKVTSTAKVPEELPTDAPMEVQLAGVKGVIGEEVADISKLRGLLKVPEAPKVEVPTVETTPKAPAKKATKKVTRAEALKDLPGMEKADVGFRESFKGELLREFSEPQKEVLPGPPSPPKKRPRGAPRRGEVIQLTSKSELQRILRSSANVGIESADEASVVIKVRGKRYVAKREWFSPRVLKRLGIS